MFFSLKQKKFNDLIKMFKNVLSKMERNGRQQNRWRLYTGYNTVGDNEVRKHLREEMNPWLGISLKIWIEVITKNSLKVHSRVLPWIPYESVYTNRTDKGFKTWGQGTTIYQESFQELKGKYGLTNRDLQLRHYLE